MEIAKAYVEVRVRQDQLDRDLAQLKQKVEGGARSTASSFAGIFASVAIGAGIKKTIDAASELEQAVGGTAAVFGTARKEIDSFAEGAAESAGLSQRAARELTSQLGGLLSGFGFTKKEAASLSIELTKLGADLSATFGGKPEEAVQALGAAMRGETDPIERYGISLNQAKVNAKAVELGLADSTSAVDANAKAQATLALITEASAGAQGQFAREADSAAGKTAIAAAKSEDAAASMGDSLLPIYSKAVDVVGKLADVFGSLPDGIQTGIIALAGVAAVAPHVIKGIGTLIDIGGRVPAVMDKLATGAFDATGALSKVAPALGVAGILGGAAAIGVLGGEMASATFHGNDLALSLANMSAAQEKQAQEALLGLDALGQLNEVVSQAADVNTVGAERIIAVAEAAGLSSEKIAELKAIVEEKSAADVQASLDAETNTAATEAATEAAKTNAEATKEQVAKLYELQTALIAAQDSNFAYRQAVDGTSDAQAALTELQKSGKATAEELDDATLTLEGAMYRQAAAAAKQAEDQAKANGATDTAEAGAAAYKAELQRLAGELAPGSPLRTQLEAYIARLNAIPAEKNTTVRITTIEQAVKQGYTSPVNQNVPKNKFLGGGFEAGERLRVGERGPEEVEFGQPGTIIPNAGSGGVQIANLTVITNSPREFYEETLWRVAG